MGLGGLGGLGGVECLGGLEGLGGLNAGGPRPVVAAMGGPRPVVADSARGRDAHPCSYGNNCQGPIACDFARPLSASFRSVSP